MKSTLPGMGGDDHNNVINELEILKKEQEELV